MAENEPNNFELEQINNDGQENDIDNTQRDVHLITNNSSNNRATNTSMISKLLFQRLLILSIVRLIIYLNKLYQDCNAVTTYYTGSDFYFCIISIISLIAPPIVYAIYLVGVSLVKEDEIDKSDVITKTVNGLLLIPWQIKRHLDVLHFVSERICMYRTPQSDEKEDIASMQRNAEVLEFFEDFYAGFLQILLQLYILMLQIEQELQTKLLIGELIGSTLCVLSMMIAVRRRDDGLLTSLLSFIGWLSLFISRVVVFTLIASFIGIYIVILCLIHALSMSIWIYSIAIESYDLHSSTNQTQERTTIRKRISVAIMVFLFFGLPSLLIWPIMFQLKENQRPLKFLFIIAIENLFGLWFIFQFNQNQTLLQTHKLLGIGVVFATILATFFLICYTMCKPELTDQVVLHEIRTNYSKSYGLYYEFCDIVFKLPYTQRIGVDLERVRNVS